jgi:hypothetical protein
MKVQVPFNCQECGKNFFFVCDDSLLTPDQGKFDEGVTECLQPKCTQCSRPVPPTPKNAMLAKSQPFHQA